MTAYSTKVLQYGGCTIRIHRPILTDSEREKREKRAQDELTNVMTQIFRREEERTA